MRREARLRANADFARVRRTGRSHAHPLMVLFTAPGGGPGGEPRVGVTVGRWAGGAVTRNRARRRVREAVRLRYEALARGYDLVFVVRAAVSEASFAAIEAAVDKLLRRAGMLVEEPCGGSRSH